jgi:hypothetical protein
MGSGERLLQRWKRKPTDGKKGKGVVLSKSTGRALFFLLR